MKVMKVIFLTSVSTAIKLLSGLIINKFISIFIGPSGLALIGQFQNFSTIIQTFSNAGLTNGVVKYTAENGIDRTLLWGTAIKITTFFSLSSGFVLIFFSDIISSYFMNDINFGYIFIIFGLTIILFSFNQLLLAIISGLKKVKLYLTLSIIQSVYSLIFTVLLIMFFKIDGALIAMVTNQSVVFFLLLFILRKDSEILISKFSLKNFNTIYAKKLLKFSLMALVSVLCLPISTLIIRNYIGSNLSWDFAGYWQAVNYISSMYLLVISTVMTVYYLPRLSSALEIKLLYEEIKSHSLVIVPLTIISAFIIYLLKEWIIVLLFSRDFFNMLVLFKYQLLGDVVKIVACLLSYVMLAKAMTRSFIVTEIISTISLTLISISFFKVYGFVGLSYAYFVNNLFYLCMVSFVISNYFRTPNDNVSL
ncbi:O-antigen translocase [Shewanella xiamenensis]|uniref:O-antigen translocase n=1 Tax=Shewanella xiamenensis TaxID=332186 RepID=UPI0024A620D1|nr:O-antigen translocase [Shewanella xiamenensis]MDI5836507.1 O-antigen translocase [Shewanella xiamenensis]MDI5840762.1 O-antigen translocase [Shewanella xiamenensis]MDI5844747.1 O-antigen translocase [Shewanella xiamenensis]MDI5848720.1 O-antigen translocase [Shewanella xiamenensis]MDI5852608.1 O-antigen translocase [Shewanella xiamenensis]